MSRVKGQTKVSSKHQVSTTNEDVVRGFFDDLVAEILPVEATTAGRAASQDARPVRISTAGSNCTASAIVRYGARSNGTTPPFTSVATSKVVALAAKFQYPAKGRNRASSHGRCHA